MIMATQFLDLFEQLKHVCVFDPASQSFTHAGRQFSLALRESEGRIWIEVRLELVELVDGDAVEMMATALATNCSVLNVLPIPVCFGLMDNPVRFVCLLRLEGQRPAVHELLAMFDRLADHSPAPV